MTAEQFVYWLQGFMEINDPGYISKSETRVIKDHLALVFDKQTSAQEITTIPVLTTTTVPDKYVISDTPSEGQDIVNKING